MALHLHIHHLLLHPLVLHDLLGELFSEGGHYHIEVLDVVPHLFPLKLLLVLSVCGFESVSAELILVD